MADMILPSSGLEWDEERLAARYAFLRRRRHEVRLDLLYYPYWLLHVQGRAEWRFFGRKTLDLLLIEDGRTGRCFRVSSFPRCREEKIHCAERTDGDFVPAGLEVEGVQRAVRVHVAPRRREQEPAEAEAGAFASALWNRRCNLPLGPHADIRCTGLETLFLYKPFWIMRPDGMTEETAKMFVFDASTGLGGVSEYWRVVTYVHALQARSV